MNDNLTYTSSLVGVSINEVVCEKGFFRDGYNGLPYTYSGGLLSEWSGGLQTESTRARWVCWFAISHMEDNCVSLKSFVNFCAFDGSCRLFNPFVLRKGEGYFSWVYTLSSLRYLLYSRRLNAGNEK